MLFTAEEGLSCGVIVERLGLSGRSGRQRRMKGIKGREEHQEQLGMFTDKKLLFSQ